MVDFDVAVAGVNVDRADVVVGFDAAVARADAQITVDRDPEVYSKGTVSETGIPVPMRVGYVRFQLEAVADLPFNDTHFTIIDTPPDRFDARFDLFALPGGDAHSAVVGF